MTDSATKPATVPDTAPNAPGAPPADRPKGDQRLGVITGVRICAKCGFNLMGQLTLREPVYGLVVARCPECGQVTPLQEYPTISNAAKRWATLFGALWVLLVLAASVGISLALMGIMFGSVQVGVDQLANALPGQWWQATTDRAAQLRTVTNMGGPFGAIDPWVLGVWFAGAVLCVIAGVASSVVMLGVRGVRLTLAPLMLLVIPIAGFAIRRAVVLTAISSGSTSKSDIAEWLMGPHVAAITLVIYAVMLIAGATFGRSIVRGLVRILLPAPMRAGLAPLWLTDGKTLPPGRGW